MFILASSCLTTSNLPWFMDLTFQVPMQYCPLQFYSDLTAINNHIHNRALFSLWLSLFIISGAISPLSPNTILDTYWPRGLIFQFHIFLPFHTVHGVLRARILKWFVIPFSSGSLSTMTHLSWVALHNIAHSFMDWGTWLWSMWLLWLIFCDCGFKHI